MAQLEFTTNGDMTITLEGLAFGKSVRDPRKNVKSYGVKPRQVHFHAEKPDADSDWAILEIRDLTPHTGYITVTIDSSHLGWYTNAQIVLRSDSGQLILQDFFQSGTRGPLGDPKKVRRYPIGHIG